MTSPIILDTLSALRGQVWEWRGSGETIGFVPTMGGLHEGHLSLIRLAKSRASKVIVSIYVNPTQFAPGEDFEAYPRQHAEDIKKLKSCGVDALYLPHKNAMYHPDHKTAVHVGGVATGLETDFRPTFFHGVALVVAKLFNRVTPDIAVFGEKDYQQLCTIRRMVTDLDFPVSIIGGPIARDSHGLALSSRNQYFDSAGLKIARQLNVIMRDCAAELGGGADIQKATLRAKNALLAAGFSSVDYVSVANADTLLVQTDGHVGTPSRLLIAAHCEGVRLIDNCAI